MAQVSVGSLPEKTTIGSSDVLLVEDGSTTSKVTKANLLKEINEELTAIDGKLGDIDTVLDAINGEVI